MDELETLRWQRLSLGIIDKEIEYHKNLFLLTNQSKLKEKHRRAIRFNEAVKLSMLSEYGWH